MSAADDQFFWVEVDPQSRKRPERKVKAYVGRRYATNSKPRRIEPNTVPERKHTFTKDHSRFVEYLPHATDSTAVSNKTQEVWYIKIPVNPQNILGSGGLDPLNMFPEKNVPRVAHGIISHAVLHIWPIVNPSYHTSINEVTYAWLQSCMRSPMAFYSFAWAAGLHRLRLTDMSETSFESLIFQSYRTKAISLVRSHVEQLTGLPTDDLLVSILILAAHGPRRAEVLTHTHPVSPLAKLQMLDYYGNLEYEPMHQFALYELVERLGGLDKIQMAGLPITLQFAELLYCTQTGNCPRWPLVKSVEFALHTLSFNQDNAHHQLQKSLASGFSSLSISAELDAAISRIKICTAVLDQHNRTNDPVLQRLIPIRTAAQYELLRISRESLDSMAKLCQDVLLIYSDMVVFPLPASTRLRSKLASNLGESLSHLLTSVLIQSDSEFRSTPIVSLCLWAAVFGWIAAEQHMLLRDRFRDHVLEITMRLSIDTIVDLKKLLTDFMWWHAVCDVPLELLWDDLVILREYAVIAPA